MKKQKMQLSELKVESFTTSKQEEVKGGITPAITIPIIIGYTVGKAVSEAAC
ncbi:pinensin family lanthipeptide [Roseivirga sp. BDSF3-8]|uniref:pinensin family lanthipeptide n=1 Tax=Roseivirga sp. BDSF3-8 TaxID=3241598 RepID=UPI003531E79B